MDKLEFPELAESEDLALLRARKEITELKAKLAVYEDILKENDLLDSAPAVSDEQRICLDQISKMKEISDKGPLMIEDIKALEILVKTLTLARGKAMPEIKEKKGKKDSTTDVATLLKIAEVKRDK